MRAQLLRYQVLRRCTNHRYFAGSSTAQPRDDESSASTAAPVVQSPAIPTGANLLKSRLGIYAELSKARLSSLVVLTAGAGYAAGVGPFDPLTFSALAVGTTLAAASANTFNQWIERERDKTMKRTCERPLPSGRVSAPEAFGWGVFSAGSSVALLAAGTNPITAGLGAFNIGLYALPYTLSKPHTEWNTWTGALVGAIPPVMGWVAAGGELMDPEPLLLGSTLFLWQFPHFFALAWIHRKDYSRGGHQMVPVNDPTGDRTAALVMNYSLAMLPLPIIASALDTTSWMFAVEGVAISSYAVYLASHFKRERTNENARRVFKLSLWQLPLTLALFVFHRKSAAQDEESEETSSALSRAKASAKQVGQQLCLHEALVTPGGGKVMCPKTDAVTVVPPPKTEP